MGVVGGVVSDQAEADEEMSVKQRLILAGGSVLAEGGGAVRDLTGEQLGADTLEVAGKYMIISNWCRRKRNEVLHIHNTQLI